MIPYPCLPSLQVRDLTSNRYFCFDAVGTSLEGLTVSWMNSIMILLPKTGGSNQVGAKRSPLLWKSMNDLKNMIS